MAAKNVPALRDVGVGGQIRIGRQAGRYPIELTPSGPQPIPATSRSAGLAVPQTSRRRRSGFRAAGNGPTYVFRCTVCRKLFERKTYDGALRSHKNPAGYQCYGSYGTYVRTK